jgi:hypothetical protein
MSKKTTNNRQQTTNKTLFLTFFLFLIFNFSFLIFNCEANATIRYVSPTGNNIPPYLTWEDAANSIQDCINVSEFGDTIYVANGVYKENLIINTQISLIGLSADSTFLNGLGLGDNTISVYADFIIENFNIYGKGNGVGDAAIRNFQATNLLTVKNCRISEAFIGIGWVSILMNSSFIAENIYLKNLTNGISFTGNGVSTVSNCVMILNNINSNGVFTGTFSEGTNYITNNIILFTGSSNPGSGISVDAVKEVHIYNNLISGFTYNIYFDTVTDSAFIKNNVLIYQSAGGVASSIRSFANRLFINNIVLAQNRRGIRGDGLINSDYNLFWENLIDIEGISYGDSDRVADPMFVKDTLPTFNGNYDFHLQAFSPGIDKGDPEILDLDSSRSDIGLYGGPYGEKISKYPDLPPKPPVNLSAVIDTNGILIKWNRNSEADTSHYNVYRDTVTNFNIDSTRLISMQVDTFFVQQPPYKSSQYVYKITCVDNQGNESLPSEEFLVKPVSVDEYPFLVNDYILYQNYPNPFNPTTTIGYKLKERGYVKLMVYDITGSLVAVLVNQEQGAGYYEVEFGLKSQDSNLNTNLASGIYLYRIEVIGEGRIPVYTDMKKMILIK